MTVTDVLSDVDPRRDRAAAAPLGSSHQYRIRPWTSSAASALTWTESPVARLEKHIPPPLPVGPQPRRRSSATRRGSRRRSAYAQDDPRERPRPQRRRSGDYSAVTTSAVVLEWGWRTSERELDPTTQEFRVYAQSRVPTVVPGVITSVALRAPASGCWASRPTGISSPTSAPASG